MAVALVNVLNPVAQIQKARDARRKGDLSQIQKALETYYNDFGRYPAADTSLSNYRIIGAKTDGTTGALDWGYTGWQYMNTLPKDPSSPSRNYIYYSSTDGQSFYLYASLERGANDSQACNSSGSACSNVPSGSVTASCGTGAPCNYGISSPNVSP
jgi:type II secretory pathway pseudopilin PulG